MSINMVQVLENEPYDKKCDVYSFGICLWEIYCCDMPYPHLRLSDLTSSVVYQVYITFFYLPLTHSCTHACMHSNKG
jgi:serine/threonine protein kinase